MKEELTRKHRYWRNRIFALTWLAYAGFYLCRKNLSVIVPELKNQGLTDYQYADIIFYNGLLYCLGQFFNGLLSDRYGPRLVVGIGLLLAVISNILMGAYGNVFLLLLLLNCVNGLGQSTGWSGLVKNMSTWFHRRERGVVMAWWSTNYVLGGFIATSIATYCVFRLPLFSTLGWRRGFLFPALLLSIVTLGFIGFNRNKPSDVGFPDLQDDGELGGGEPKENLTDRKIPWRSFLDILVNVFSRPSVWMIAFMYFFLKLTRYAFLFWLPLYLMQRWSYRGEAAGYTSSIFELGGFIGAIAAGYLSDKVFQARRFPVGAIFLWGLGLCFLAHPIIANWGHLYNAIGIGLIGFLTFGPDTLMSGAAAQDEGCQRGAATAVGFINGVGSLGQMISGYVVAYVSNTYGWDALFHLFVFFALFGGLLLSTKWRYVPKSQ